MQEAFRGQKSLVVWVGDFGMLRQWQGVQKASELNLGNVKFLTAEEVFDEAVLSIKVSLALTNMTTFRKALIPHHLYPPAAIGMLVRDVKSWYEYST